MIGNFQLSNRRILITGASGFIGCHLCNRLTKMGCTIHAVSRMTHMPENIGVQWWQGDLVDIESVRKLLISIKPEIIFHLAGYPKGSRNLDMVSPTLYSNLVSTVNLLTSASDIDCERIILTGSFEEPGSDNLSLVPGSPYAITKWASSTYARMFNILYQLPTVILRLFMVYGPGQFDLSKLVPYVICSSLRGEVIKTTSGERLIDWIYVEDVVDGLIAAAQASNVDGLTMDLGSGNLVSIQTLVKRLVEMINPQTFVQFGALPDRPMEQLGVANIERTSEIIGWRPRISLEEGLRLTIAWYRDKITKGEISLSSSI